MNNKTLFKFTSIFLAWFCFKVLIAQFFIILVDKKSYKQVFFKFSSVFGTNFE